MKTAYEIELNVLRTCVEEIAAMTNENLCDLTYALRHFSETVKNRISERQKTIEGNIQMVETDGFRIVVDHNPVNSDFRLIFVLVLISKGFGRVNEVIKSLVGHVMGGNGMVKFDEELVRNCEAIGALGENLLEALSQENLELAQQLFENEETEKRIETFYEQKSHFIERDCRDLNAEFISIRVACMFEEIVRLLKSNMRELIYMIAGDGVPIKSSYTEVTLD